MTKRAQKHSKDNEHHHHTVSNTQSKTMNNDHSHSSSSKPRVKKLFRYDHHRQHQSKNKSQPINFLHTTIRSNDKHDVLLIPTILTLRPDRKETNKTLVTVNSIKKSKMKKYPLNITTFGSSESPISPTSENAWYDIDSELHTKSKRKTNAVQSSINSFGINSIKTVNLDQSVNRNTQTRDGWPDWAGSENKTHRSMKKKKKKKCSQLCIITSVIIGIILLMIITILLAVLLTRPKTQGTSQSAVLRWNPTGLTVAGVTGQFGNASNQLNVPVRLVLDWSYALYIADWSNNRIQKYQKDASFGQTVAGQATGSYNSTSKFLYYPGDMAVDWNGNVYVADTYNNRIQLWNSGSSTGVTIAGTGLIGNSSNTLNRPYGLTRDPSSGTLYIADTFNNRVMCYLSGASSGSIVAGGNGAGTSQTQLNTPTSVYFDVASNSLIITNSNANNVIRWVLGDSTWTLIAGNINGVNGNSSTAFYGLMDAILDPMGNVYVADRKNHRIQFFPVGETNGVTIVGTTGISGNDSTLLNNPFSVALDSQLHLYVADAFNSRVQKFSRY